MIKCRARLVSRSRGFTLIEIMVAVAVISILGYLVAGSLGGQSDAAKSSVARQFLVERFPRAVVQMAQSVPDGTRLNSSDQLIPYGVEQETAWGGEWTMGDNRTISDRHIVKYPIRGSKPIRIGRDLVRFMTGDNADGTKRFAFVQSASLNGQIVTVVYAPLK